MKIQALTTLLMLLMVTSVQASDTELPQQQQRRLPFKQSVERRSRRYRPGRFLRHRRRVRLHPPLRRRIFVRPYIKLYPNCLDASVVICQRYVPRYRVYPRRKSYKRRRMRRVTTDRPRRIYINTTAGQEPLFTIPAE